MIVEFTCNGKAVRVEAPEEMRALDLIRDSLGLTGTKEGCGRGECGACTILLDGRPVNACLLFAPRLAGRTVETIEGLAGPDGSLHPIQEAFLEEGAVQCGYCTPGMVLSAKALLDRRPDPTDEEIEDAISGNLCRCTGYARIVRAIRAAARRDSAEGSGGDSAEGSGGDWVEGSGGDPAAAATGLRVVGTPVRRIDGPELVTGRAVFTADLRFPGMLYGCVRRAGTAAGRLRGVAIEEALQVPGVVRVLRAADIPGPNLIGILPPFDQPLLAAEEIRYAGESVALVVARSREAARRGAASLEPQIEPWEPILEPEEALREGARKIHPGGNVTFSKKLVKGDVERGFQEAEVVVEGVYRTSFQEHAYLEPEAVCAVPGGEGRTTVYASCQSPFHLRGHIAANLGVPASRVRVIQSCTGGSFGGKDDVATEMGSLAAVAASLTGRPVTIVHEREESIVGSNLRHAARIEYRTGARRDGRITAREARILLDGGAYASESPFVTMKALIHAAGPYDVPNVRVECTTAYTNLTYCGAFRGFGVPQVTFASESQLDELAGKLELDPLELRLLNALRPGGATATGQVFQESVGFVETLERVGEIRRERGLGGGGAPEAAPVPAPAPGSGTAAPRHPQPPGEGRWLYGTGIAGLLQGISNGAEGIDVVGASVQVGQDGSVLVNVGLSDMGQGSRTVFAQVAAEVLGVGLEQVTVGRVDTDAVHDSGPTVASRSTTVGGMAVLKAAGEVKKSLLKMASLMFKAEEEKVELAGGFARLQGVPEAAIPLREVATAAYWSGFPLMNLAFSRAPDASFDHETHQGSIYIAYNFGTHLMRVGVDRLTGRVEVLRHVAAHDVGKVINPAGVVGQVEGASLMGYALAHLEKILYDREGRILNANFADYAVPTVMDRLPTETILVEHASPTGPWGAKGIGEPPVAGAAAAFANAVADAVGVRFTRLPITREEILSALRGP